MVGVKLKSNNLLLIVLMILISTSSIACAESAVKDNNISITEKHSMKENNQNEQEDKKHPKGTNITLLSKEEILNKYKNLKPKEFGEHVNGIIDNLNTKEKVIALTLDACGGNHGSEYDKELIDYLVSNNMPATLFINSRWIDSNMQTFKELSSNPLFDIENHGTLHKPLSVDGKSAYKIKGTNSQEEALKEVLDNHEKIEKLTGRKPKFFRAGTANYDDISINMLKDLKIKVIGFNINGDAGATFSENMVYKSVTKSQNGSIIICHMNKPRGSTAEGLKKSLPKLISEGYRFVKLEEYIK